MALTMDMDFITALYWSLIIFIILQGRIYYTNIISNLIPSNLFHFNPFECDNQLHANFIRVCC